VSLRNDEWDAPGANSDRAVAAKAIAEEDGLVALGGRGLVDAPLQLSSQPLGTLVESELEELGIDDIGRLGYRGAEFALEDIAGDQLVLRHRA